MTGGPRPDRGAVDLAGIVETRSGMQLFVRAVREGWPMDAADRDAAIARMRAIAAEGRGRVSWRARLSLAELFGIMQTN